MQEELKKDVAVFRFSVIAELVGGRKLNRGEKEKVLREKCEYIWDIPGSGRTHISRSTILYWVRMYESGGRKLESLCPDERSDKGSLRAIDEDTIALLCNLKKKHSEASLPVIMRIAREQKILPADFKGSRATIYRLFKKEGLADSEKIYPDRRKFESLHANDMWQSDCMYGPYVNVDGKMRRAYLFAIIDDASRLITHAEFYLQQNLDCYKDCIIKALSKRGLPKKLYVDNGPAFKSKELSYATASLGIALIYAKPYQPEGKGKIERWFKTVRMQFLPLCNDALTLDALNTKLTDWFNNEYNNRIHSATNKTPYVRYFEDIQLINEAPKYMTDYFRKRVNRKVDKDRTVTLLKRIYEAPVELIGKTVTLHYQASDSSRVEIFYQNKSYGMLIPVNVNVNCSIKRNCNVTELISKDTPEISTNTKNENFYTGGKLFERRN